MNAPINLSLALSRTLLPTAALYRQRLELPERVALIDTTDSVTYEQLLRLVKWASAKLLAAGIKDRDRLVLVSANNLKFTAIVYACYFIGVIVVPVNFRLAKSEIRFILQDCKPTAVVYDDERSELLLPLCDEMNIYSSNLEDLVGQSSRSEMRSDEVHVYDDMEPVIHSLREPQAIMYTSGTTGRPKGAVLTYENFAAVIARITADWRCESGRDVFYITTPMFHIGAFDFVLTGLANGATCVLAASGGFNAGHVLDDLERQKITHTYFVPVQMQLIVEEQRARPRSLCLKFYAWGAAPASAELLTQMRELFPYAESQTTFGQTETSGLGVTMTHEDSLRKCGSIGRPDRYFSVRVVDSGMVDVVPGEVGEIVYRGAGVMDRYWGNQEATDAAFRGGWFHSGDLVKRDQDGFLYIIDRLKDMIISGGENIYSAELENVISQYGKVKYVAVVGKSDDRWGEVPVALVVPKDPLDPPLLADIVEFCSGKLARYKMPKMVVICRDFPRNATGKVRKNILREKLEFLIGTQ